jgi:hypothetical protein
MKLTVFPSDKGDCLLLTSDDGRHVLIDGGMGSSYRQFVAPALARMREDGQHLDVVYVSHIDADHIEGILQLTEDAFKWRVFEIHLRGAADDGVGDAPDGFKRPVDHPRPPAIKKVWYNAFAAMVPNAAGETKDTLEQTAMVLALSDVTADHLTALTNRELVTSIRQGILLTNRLDKKQLDCEVNPEAKGKLMQVPMGKAKKTREPIAVGSMRFFTIGPFREDLNDLRKEWEEWVAENATKLKELEEQSEADARRLLPNEFDRLRGELAARVARLGNRSAVTVPNLASLMFLVEEGDATILLTGDGHGREILRGLEAWDKLDGDGTIHVDVLKVQHHGSEHNLDEEFCRRFTADHYIFCANGAHENPNLDVLKAIVDSRCGPAEKRSPNPRVGDRFTFWFNSSSTFERDGAKDNIEHMKKVERDVRSYVQESQGQMEAVFIADQSENAENRLELTVGGE